MKTALISLLSAGVAGWVSAAVPLVPVPEIQPVRAQVRRVVDALEMVGAPLGAGEKATLDGAFAETDPQLAAAKLQGVLDAHVLLAVDINPEMRVKVQSGEAAPRLVEAGWRTFLVKVHNESGTTAELRVTSPQGGRLHESPAAEVGDRWLAVEFFNGQPMRRELGGLPLEYRVIQLYARDAGRREAKLSFNVGQGTQDLGFRSDVDVLFTCDPARPVGLKIRDENGAPTTGALRITDGQGHVFPAPAKRLAPDFFFHPQVYRADGETLRLPDGTYSVEFRRGPESIAEKRTLKVGPDATEWTFQVRRWIDPSLSGWISGDHHIHAAGCAHYNKPTEGVLAEDMMRHVLGEDLKVGANLTWGPCFDYQKQFFRGVDDPVSRFPYLLRYDVEVSGFGSHESGHLCLLRLKDQIYPGGESKNHWPKLGLNTLKWAKRQGALVGPAHSGWGLEVPTRDLPNYIVPPYDGIGANEYVVDVTHEVPGPGGRTVPAVDFLSMVDTPSVWELNMWYHTLNAGYRTRISGETDFPCIYGERVGLGRSYVKLGGKWTYEDWCEGIREGRNYVSDGFSHLMDFKADGHLVGGAESEVKLAGPGRMRFTARVGARLEDEPNPSLQQKPYSDKPYWHLERARIGVSREVPLELIANGVVVARTNWVADGSVREIAFDVPVERSGWYALRILPSSHTNPFFVEVGGRPIRASRRSVQWCLDGVEQCWKSKERLYTGAEHGEAVAAFDHARAEYRRRLGECLTD